jgi:regulatory protein
MSSERAERGPRRGAAEARSLDAAGARRVAGDLLSRRPWTVADLRARLIRRGAPAEMAEAVVADLVGRGHLDDGAFAVRWVEVRSARGYGPTRLRAELSARGVAPPLIETALATLAPDAALERARATARRRWPVLRGLPRERAAGRLRDYLLRRGHRPDLVARVVRELAGDPGGAEPDATMTAP